MSDIETADAHAQRIEALWKHGAHHCIYSQGEAAKLIEARDNAVRIALLSEVEALAKSNDVRNADWACLIQDAFDHVCAKYGAKPHE